MIASYVIFDLAPLPRSSSCFALVLNMPDTQQQLSNRCYFESVGALCCFIIFNNPSIITVLVNLAHDSHIHPTSVFSGQCYDD